ncbi:MAG: enoyl-CoA hydratase/isomerase family protein, partial [Candidatus Dormibacteraeota bacterium]|nr:enoyl-CoA hydratase/isomerase family protein [Candidatus Dormibacteraeota bacterium]
MALGQQPPPLEALDSDAQPVRSQLTALKGKLESLPPKPERDELQQATAADLNSRRQALSDQFWQRHAATAYHQLTDGGRRFLRVKQLVNEATRQFPGLLPTEAEMQRERSLLQRDKEGLEIDQGVFVGHVLGDRECGLHLIHAMSLPTPQALASLEQFRREGSIDLGPIRVDRRGAIGHITIQNHQFLNSEDDLSTQALETAVDLVLLDPQIAVSALRGGEATHPKHKGRRVFGAGINLTHLYHGRISLVGFFVERELGSVSKMYRGHPSGAFRTGDLEQCQEKPFIAAVESFAIGGACQWLLVMDRVIANRDSYFNLPARKEGIVPGLANLRLPRFVGERRARQAIFFNRDFAASSAEGALLADEVVEPAEMEVAIERAAAELQNAGVASLTANRRQLRLGAEPLDTFRAYMAG